MTLEEEIMRLAERHANGKTVLVHEANRNACHVVFDKDPTCTFPYAWALHEDHGDGETRCVASGRARTLEVAATNAYRTWIAHLRPIEINAWDLPRLLPDQTVNRVCGEDTL